MKGLRILVADDEPGVRDCAVRVLRYQGCEVHAARDAEDAFAALRAGPHYDVILVDLVMPDMEGLRLIREMLSTDPGLRFVVISGKLISPAERMDLARLGVRLCAKPFRNEELFQSVRDMARREARPEAVHA
ncbi:MAG: response regulator [Planctomycetota bacterium]|nr:response regulator [Planctomycetota bacterium]